MLIPFPMLAFPLFLMFSEVGVVNTVFAVFLPSVVSPFGVYLARVYAAAAAPAICGSSSRSGCGSCR